MFISIVNMTIETILNFDCLMTQNINLETITIFEPMILTLSRYPLYFFLHNLKTAFCWDVTKKIFSFFFKICRKIDDAQTRTRELRLEIANN